MSLPTQNNTRYTSNSSSDSIEEDEVGSLVTKLLQQSTPKKGHSASTKAGHQSTQISGSRPIQGNEPSTRTYSGRQQPYIGIVAGENPDKKPELSTLNRHYRRSIVKESAKQKIMQHKTKTTISHTSSFVTDDGAAAKIRQELARVRLQSGNFVNPTDDRATGNFVTPASNDDQSKRASIPVIIQEEDDLLNSIENLNLSNEVTPNDDKVKNRKSQDIAPRTAVFFKSLHQEDPPISNKNRVAQIAQFVEDDDLNGFKLWGVTRIEMLNIRFGYNMNLLQLVCHEEAVQIFKYLTAHLDGDNQSKAKMANHRDAHLGSQAIHLAATTGNKFIIDTLMEEFQSNCKEFTLGRQTVNHLAAQRNDGIVSIHLFTLCHGIDVNHADKKGATALHFATISLQLKNVQALIKLGANPNAQDVEGNTPLHLCLKILAEEENRNFEKLKNIGKELLFSGASRSIMNAHGQLAIDLLDANKEMLDEFDFKKMHYVLSEPQGCTLLRMTRPIEKVERRNTLQRSVLAFDIMNFLFFGVTACFETNEIVERKGTIVAIETFVILTTIAFFFTALFYALTLINPGYVPKQKNFLRLLERLVSERYHLDYVCVFCENLRPENADHCNFCNRCVQKFDHHCVFVNNCLGYKNHKWFLLFLLSFTIFMFLLFVHSLMSIITISQNFTEDKTTDAWKLALDIYFIIIVVLHSPIVLLQLQSQFDKLCKQNQSGGQVIDDNTSHYNDGETNTKYDQNTNYERSRAGSVVEQQNTSVFSQNIRTIFTFQPQTQEYLYQQLFGERLEDQADTDAIQTQQPQQPRSNNLKVVVEVEELDTSRLRTNSQIDVSSNKFNGDSNELRHSQNSSRRHQSVTHSSEASGYDSDDQIKSGIRVNSRTNTKQLPQTQRKSSVDDQLDDLTQTYQLPHLDNTSQVSKLVLGGINNSVTTSHS